MQAQAQAHCATCNVQQQSVTTAGRWRCVCDVTANRDSQGAADYKRESEKERKGDGEGAPLFICVMSEEPPLMKSEAEVEAIEIEIDNNNKKAKRNRNRIQNQERGRRGEENVAGRWRL